MLLFNKAISAYGNLVKDSLGFEGLFLYTTEILKKLSDVFEQKLDTGLRSNLYNYDGNCDTYDVNCLQLVFRIRDLYLNMTSQLSLFMQDSEVNLNSDKVESVYEQLKHNIQKRNLKR